MLEEWGGMELDGEGYNRVCIVGGMDDMGGNWGM